VNAAVGQHNVVAGNIHGAVDNAGAHVTAGLRDLLKKGVDALVNEGADARELLLGVYEQFTTEVLKPANEQNTNKRDSCWKMLGSVLGNVPWLSAIGATLGLVSMAR
jgi:hypothetical protein